MGKEIIRTVCEGCMSGCGVMVRRENGRVTKISGDPDHPQNRGRLCIKGITYDELLYQYAPDYSKIQALDLNFTEFYKPHLFTTIQFPNIQKFDFPSLQGRLLSSSYSPLPNHPNYNPLMEGLKEIFEKYKINNKIQFIYDSEVNIGRIK